MNYTLHQLRIFVEVVRQESVTRAAEELHMTQPALSIQLKNFQGQFDIPLTEVVGRKLFITEFGRSIGQQAGNVLREAETIQYKTKEYGDLLTGRLSVSSASTGKYVVPYFLSGFLKQHKGIDLILDVTNKSRVLQSLHHNEIDFALVSVVPEGLKVDEESLLPNHLYMVGNTPQLDEDRPYIFREEGSATRLAMDHYLGQQQGRKRMELTSNEAVKQALLAGLGYSIIPLIGIHNELSSEELYIIPAPSLPITTTWRLIWLRDKKLSPVAKAYLEYVRHSKQQIINENFKWYQDYQRKQKVKAR